MGKIYLNGARFYGHHGCLEEERVVGGYYIVDVVVEFNLSEAGQSKKLKDTVDYTSIYNCVKREVERPTKLLETVLERTVSSIKKINPRIISVDVKIEKTNPPIGGAVGSVAVRKKI